jgi:Myb-like DNA-binding protein REB1
VSLLHSFPAITISSISPPLAAALPHRSFNSVYARVRRAEHPMKQRGFWVEAEDAELTPYAFQCLVWCNMLAERLFNSAVRDLGQSWEKISLRVGRTASDCKDHYRNHLLKQENCITGQVSSFIVLASIRLVYWTGKWSPDEEAKLAAIVTWTANLQGQITSSDSFWGKISEEMGFTCGISQCRDKW